MSIFYRIKLIISSFVNSILDSCENPAYVVDQYIREAEDSVNQSRSALIKARVNVRKREKSVNDIKSAIRKCEDFAHMAFTNGKSDDIEVFAGKILNLKDDLAVQEAYLKEANDIAAELEDGYTIATSQYEEIKSKRDNLKSRADVTALKKRIAKNCNLKDKNSEIYLGFARMEDKIEVERMEAEEEEQVNKIPLSKADEIEYTYKAQEREQLISDEVSRLKAMFSEQ